MRAIDADTLLEKVNKIQPWEPYLGKYAQGIRHCMELVNVLVQNAPTIEPSIQPSSSCAHENDQDLQQTCNNLATDTISRQEAIDALDGEIEITGRTNAEAVKGYVRLVKDRLERLPSAQPDLSSYSDKLWRNAYDRGRKEAMEEIIRCGECKYMMADGSCYEFADDNLRPSASDFCSYAERREE